MTAAGVHPDDVTPPHDTSKQHVKVERPAARALLPEHKPIAELPPPTAEQPPQKPRGRRIWLWIIVLLVLAGGGYFAWNRFHGMAAAAPAGGAGRGAGRPLPVVAARSYTGDVPIYLQALGNVAAYNTVMMRTRVDGQLLKLHFSEGQLVHEGDLLFEIDPRPFQVQLTQAQGQMAKDQATLNNAKLDLARYQAAAEAVSQQQIDTALAAVTSAEGTVKADEGAIDAANLNLVYTRIGAPITGTIGLRSVDVGNMLHASDANGLAVITQLQPISVTFNIPEDHLPDVQKAMAGAARGRPLVTEAFDRSDSTRIATGALEALDNQIDVTTATVRLKSVFKNEDNVLYPNQFVNVHLLVNTLKGVVLVPDAAVQHSPTSNFVYVVTDTPPKEAAEGGGRGGGSGRGNRSGQQQGQAGAAKEGGDQKPQYVEMREITLGPVEGHLAVIERGLKAGETVVTDGVDKLEPGSAVVVHFPDENRGGARSGQRGGREAGASSRPATRGRGGSPDQKSPADGSSNEAHGAERGRP